MTKVVLAKTGPDGSQSQAVTLASIFVMLLVGRCPEMNQLHMVQCMSTKTSILKKLAETGPVSAVLTSHRI